MDITLLGAESAGYFPYARWDVVYRFLEEKYPVYPRVRFNTKKIPITDKIMIEIENRIYKYVQKLKANRPYLTAEDINQIFLDPNERTKREIFDVIEYLLKDNAMNESIVFLKDYVNEHGLPENTITNEDGHYETTFRLYFEPSANTLHPCLSNKPYDGDDSDAYPIWEQRLEYFIVHPKNYH